MAGWIPEDDDANCVRRFWERVDSSGDCWVWLLKPMHEYGVFSHHGGMTYAHRYSYSLAYGSIPEGKVIDHLCHNTICVRPGHLRAATHRQNMQNMKGPNRGNPSGVRGVSRHQGRWRVRVSDLDSKVHYRYADSLEDAARIASELRLALGVGTMGARPEEALNRAQGEEN